MKTVLIILIVIAIGFVSCDNANPELDAATIKSDSLQGLLNDRDETVNEFFETFNEIEENLALIKEKENIITVNTSFEAELSPDTKDKINDDILLIYELLQENKEKLNYLNNKLKNSELKILELNKMIACLTEEISNKDSEINKLREELTILNIIVDDLNASIDTLTLKSHMQDDVIDEQDEALHIAFYAYGTKKELKENGVITNDGGFIGIGAAQKLTEDFNQEYFTKIDIRKTTKISLMCKKAKVLTTHSSGAYVFDGPDGKVDNLIITNYEKFWAASKYLVIIID